MASITQDEWAWLDYHRHCRIINDTESLWCETCEKPLPYFRELARSNHAWHELQFTKVNDWVNVGCETCATTNDAHPVTYFDLLQKESV